MSSNDLVYRTHADWREAYGSELFGGFARMLKPSPGSVVYRGVVQARANAATQFTPAGKRYASKHAERTPEKVPPSRKVPRWTTERIAALPRTSGSLTRIGDELTRGPNSNPYVACKCDGGSAGCVKRILVEANVFARDSRPRGCKACSHERARRANAFTSKGYRNGRDIVAAQKGKAA
jgi:hypothetical protein